MPHPICPGPHGGAAATAWASKKKMIQTQQLPMKHRWHLVSTEGPRPLRWLQPPRWGWKELQQRWHLGGRGTKCQQSAGVRNGTTATNRQQRRHIGPTAGIPGGGRRFPRCHAQAAAFSISSCRRCHHQEVCRT